MVHKMKWFSLVNDYCNGIYVHPRMLLLNMKHYPSVRPDHSVLAN